MGGKIFRTCPDRPWGPPNPLYNGYRVFLGVNYGRSVLLTTHPFYCRGHGRVELYLSPPSGPQPVCNGNILYHVVTEYIKNSCAVRNTPAAHCLPVLPLAHISTPTYKITISFYNMIYWQLPTVSCTFYCHSVCKHLGPQTVHVYRMYLQYVLWTGMMITRWAETRSQIYRLILFVVFRLNRIIILFVISLSFYCH